MWNITFLVTGVVYIALLIILFSSKKKINSEENKYFRALIIVNALEYVVELSMQLIVRFAGIELPIINVIAKAYLIMILAWAMLFTLYVILLCYRNGNNYTYKRSTKMPYLKFLFFLISYSSLLILCCLYLNILP